jgi:hypothetical protein
MQLNGLAGVVSTKISWLLFTASAVLGLNAQQSPGIESIGIWLRRSLSTGFPQKNRKKNGSSLFQGFIGPADLEIEYQLGVVT